MRLETIYSGARTLLVVACLTAGVTIAQNANTGEIKGTVQDATRALVQGATVTITNLETGVSVTTTTNAAGIFDSPSVPTGSYTIKFSKTGFKDLVRERVTVRLQTVTVDATLGGRQCL